MSQLKQIHLIWKMNHFLLTQLSNVVNMVRYVSVQLIYISFSSP